MKGGKRKPREGKEKGKQDLPQHAMLLLDRLRGALNLGIKTCNEGKRKWQCQDVEIMRHAVRLTSRFSGFICRDTWQHPLIKDSVSDILIALEGILQSEHDAALTLAADITSKILTNLGSSIQEYEYSDLIFPLSKLLSSRQAGISISSAIALKCIVSNLRVLRGCRKSTAVWDAMKKTEAAESILVRLHDHHVGFSVEFVSLLKEILLRWPESRYSAWNKIKLMDGPFTLNIDDGSRALLSVIQIFSSLVLCADVAMAMLDRESLITRIVQCLWSSQPTVRVHAFTLLRDLLRSEKSCKLLPNPCLEQLIRGVVHAIYGPSSSSHLVRIPNDQIPLAAAACQVVALMSQWPGAHHAYLWKFGIDCALHTLLIPDDFSNSVKTNQLIYNTTDTGIRILGWDTLGFLSKYCEDSHLLKRTEGASHVEALIEYACTMTLKVTTRHHHTVMTSEEESIFRAVTMMVFSPSKCISSRSRDAFLKSETTFSDHSVGTTVDIVKLRRVDSPHFVVGLSWLAFFSRFARYRKTVLEREPLGVLMSIIDGCINGEFHFHETSVSPSRTCCWFNTENPRTEDHILLYGLQALSQLLPFLDFPFIVYQSLFSKLKQIAGSEHVDRDSRWYASHCLAISFDFYGFPDSVGDTIWGFVDGDEFTDLQLMFPNGETLRVHGAVLAAQCPGLVPSEKITEEGNTKVIHLSHNVDVDALRRLLEYVYTRHCCHIHDDLTRQLSVLAKKCNVKSLYNILERNLPKYGLPVPRCDFFELLDNGKCPFSDITLEAKEMQGKWECSTCKSCIPHVHAHKIVLISRSSYMRALFQSGMRESNSQTIKIPITHKALLKLVAWFYTGKLPKLEFTCKWNHTSREEQYMELMIYLELSWLSESWCMENVHRECMEMIILCIQTTPNFDLQIVKSAATFRLHAVISAAISRLGPLYPQLRDSGEIDGFDEDIISLLQSEYVHYCQNQ